MLFRSTALVRGELLRAVEVSGEALAAASALRTVSLTAQGRSAAVVLGVATPHGPRITLTAAVPRPVVLGAGGEIADPRDLDAVAGLCGWYDDPHGPPDWREAVSRLLVEEVLTDLDRLDPSGAAA